jgi:hypothetical protein
LEEQVDFAYAIPKIQKKGEPSFVIGTASAGPHELIPAKLW